MSVVSLTVLGIYSETLSCFAFWHFRNEGKPLLGDTDLIWRAFHIQLLPKEKQTLPSSQFL